MQLFKGRFSILWTQAGAKDRFFSIANRVIHVILGRRKIVLIRKEVQLPLDMSLEIVAEPIEFRRSIIVDPLRLGNVREVVVGVYENQFRRNAGRMFSVRGHRSDFGTPGIRNIFRGSMVRRISALKYWRNEFANHHANRSTRTCSQTTTQTDPPGHWPGKGVRHGIARGAAQQGYL